MNYKKLVGTTIILGLSAIAGFYFYDSASKQTKQKQILQQHSKESLEPTNNHIKESLKKLETLVEHQNYSAARKIMGQIVKQPQTQDSYSKLFKIQSRIPIQEQPILLSYKDHLTVQSVNNAYKQLFIDVDTLTKYELTIFAVDICKKIEVQDFTKNIENLCELVELAEIPPSMLAEIVDPAIKDALTQTVYLEDKIKSSTTQITSELEDTKNYELSRIRLHNLMRLSTVGSQK